MPTYLALAFAAVGLTSVATAAPSQAADSTYKRLFESGQTFQDFVAKAEHRQDQWKGNYERGVVADALVTRAAAAAGPWRLLVVTYDGCSDSVNSVPYLARLVERVPGIEMRLVTSSVGQSVMESHRTPDGRAATPTVILLDSAYVERGAWIERPAELRAWMAEQKGKLSDSEIGDGRLKWYDGDRGAKTLEEIVGMIESAAARKQETGDRRQGG